MTEKITSYKILASSLVYPTGELFQALCAVPEFRDALAAETLTTLQREHMRLFTPTVAGGFPPYEMEYGKTEIFLKTQLMADVGGFYRAFGLDISEKTRERPDYIGAELEFMHWLTLKEERAAEKGDREALKICRDAAQKFLADHLGRWAAYLGRQIREQSKSPFYRLIGERLAAFVQDECRRYGAKPEPVAGWSPPAETEGEFACGGDEGADSEGVGVAERFSV